MPDGSGRVRLSALDNGLRIVTEVMPHVATAALGVWIGAGARHERADEHGLSHLLEHMAFKGTATRDARTIVETIESAGGDLNAETGVEHTSYTVRIMGEDVALGMDILADILTNSVFDPDELAREKNVILQEIGSIEDMPDELATDLFLESAFPGQALGRSILGTPESVNGFSREAILAYLARNYRASRMVVAAVGAVDHAQVEALARKLFGAIPAGAPEAPQPAVYCGSEKRLRRSLEQTHLLVGYRGMPFLAHEAYAMQVFAHLLGGGMSSRLFQEVREQRGLAYSVDAFHWGFSDAGVFGMSAGTAPADVGELLPVMLGCLREAAEQASDKEVDRARAQLKLSYLSALESPAARADQIARQVLSLGKVLPHKEVVAKLDDVTSSDVRFVGSELMKSAPTFVSVGPVSGVLRRAGVIPRLLREG
ncbi:M16 family metallopeptidase [Pseudochelatococcus contaminans]|uniref:Putative Zn-dependent peptidase n=1 Tax=Pseudochelatococcus contaminans TaxID=1538103 RepID=A0A7W5Z381_9HYPH|nr:pitrilysin family protein [Pseudochelatococcus contaminans]MBB3808816.1 putative Zn-dependent peptidase [Pseudochelatococcus contaminans]